MLNYLKKFAVDIFPSVAATVIGAYIVNHYIVAKPGPGTPGATIEAAADPKAKGKSEARTEAKVAPETKSGESSNLPAAGVKAKGISEKAIMEKTAAERPTVVEKAQEKTEAKAESKPEVKSADAPAETASIAAEQRRHQAPREKEKIRVILPSPVQPVASAPAAVAAAPNPAPAAPVEAAAAPDERRDANDLARAAIERLRGNGEGASRAPEVARTPDPARIEAPKVAAAPVLRPLPPPIMVSAPPAAEPPVQTPAPPRPPYAVNAEVNDPRRPTPPADIPLSRPLDLRAEAAEPSVRERTTAVAEDVLSTAKSLFHAVLPK